MCSALCAPSQRRAPGQDPSRHQPMPAAHRDASGTRQNHRCLGILCLRALWRQVLRQQMQVKSLDAPVWLSIVSARAEQRRTKRAPRAVLSLCCVAMLRGCADVLRGAGVRCVRARWMRFIIRACVRACCTCIFWVVSFVSSRFFPRSDIASTSNVKWCPRIPRLKGGVVLSAPVLRRL